MACGPNLAHSVIVFGLRVCTAMYLGYYKSQNALLDQSKTFIESHDCDLVS